MKWGVVLALSFFPVLHIGLPQVRGWVIDMSASYFFYEKIALWVIHRIPPIKLSDSPVRRGERMRGGWLVNRPWFIRSCFLLRFQQGKWRRTHEKKLFTSISVADFFPKRSLASVASPAVGHPCQPCCLTFYLQRATQMSTNYSNETAETIHEDLRIRGEISAELTLWINRTALKKKMSHPGHPEWLILFIRRINSLKSSLNIC